MNRVILAVLFCGLCAGMAMAVDSAKTHRPATPPPSPLQDEPPPYEGDILKLSELMGSLAFLADLCPDLHDPAQNGAMWRQKAQSLLDTQAKSDTLKALMAGAYNRGYQDYEVNYHACTDVARTAFSHDLSAINRIASALTRKYSGT